MVLGIHRLAPMKLLYKDNTFSDPYNAHFKFFFDSVSHITSSGDIKGGWGHLPHRRRLSPLPPSRQKKKNGQNQPLSANFWIFAPSESHFAPSMPPQKILLPPLITSARYLSIVEDQPPLKSFHRRNIWSVQIFRNE